MKQRIKSGARRCWLCLGAAALLGVFLWRQSFMPELTKTTVRAEIERGMRILQLSDLHGTWFGAGQERLVALAEKVQPDVIVMTGDFIDDTCDERAAAALIEAMAKIAPVYCVTGNHEELERLAWTGT